jgi:hypothetical protein
MSWPCSKRDMLWLFTNKQKEKKEERKRKKTRLHVSVVT